MNKLIGYIIATICIVFFIYGITLSTATAFHQIYKSIIVGMSTMSFILSLILVSVSPEKEKEITTEEE